MFIVETENKVPSSSQFPDMCQRHVYESRTACLTHLKLAARLPHDHAQQNIVEALSGRLRQLGATTTAQVPAELSSTQTHSHDKVISSHLIREEVRSLVHRFLERCIWCHAQTRERVCRLATAGLFNHEVVESLPVLNVPDGDGPARLHDCATEQPFIIPVVRQQVQRHRDCASTFSPAMARVSRGNQRSMIRAVTHMVTFDGSPPNSVM